MTRIDASRPAVMTHVAIRTKEFDETLAFYRRYAQLHIVHERNDDGIRVAWLSHMAEDPDFVIVVLQMPHESATDPSPTDHFGFDVASREEVDRIARLASEDGCLRYGPAEGGAIVGYFCMLRDPSGNICEFSHGQPINPRALQR